MVIQKPSPYELHLQRLFTSGAARLHFSQCGEDAVIWHYFHDRQDGFYVDVGCHHPFRFSNTALLAEFNQWRGINIDVDSRAISAFEAERPADTNVRAGVGRDEGVADVTIFEEGAVTSLDPAVTAVQVGTWPVRGTDRVPIRPLSALLDQYLPVGRHIDLLNVDVEGLDQTVLESNDWQKYVPSMICVEVHGFNIEDPGQNNTFCFLKQKGYTLVSHTVMTSIYRGPV